MEPTCPQCHTAIRPTDYFCFNCGKNLKPKPLSTSAQTLALYYIGTVFLPPLGFYWGWKYWKEENKTAKMHGMIMIAITVVELIVVTIWTIQFVNGISNQVGSQMNNSQLNGMEGF